MKQKLQREFIMGGETRLGVMLVNAERTYAEFHFFAPITEANMDNIIAQILHN